MPELIGILCTAVQFGAVVAGYELAGKDVMMRRRAYIPRLWALIALAAAAITLGIMTDSFGFLAALFVIYTVFAYLVTRWVTFRLRDCGWRPTIALALVLPLVNFLVPLILMFPKSWRPGDPEPRFTY